MTKTNNKQLCSKCLDNGIKNYEPCEHDFNPNEIKQINTPEEARQFAIDWQNWISDQNLSQGEMLQWWAIFNKLALKFHLVREFKSNGII